MHFVSLTSRGWILERVVVDVQVLPHKQGLNRPSIERLERVIHTIDVLASVLRNLLKVLANQPLLLDKLDVLQNVRGQLDCLGDIKQRE